MHRRLVGPVKPAMVALGRRLLPFAVVYLATQFAVRLLLAAHTRGDYADDIFGFVSPFLVGAWFDLVVFSVFAACIVVWWLALPARIQGTSFDRRATRVAFGLFLLLCLSIGVAEHLFWIEFGTRFNFIAVDYLVYTHEVLANIRQSYPVGTLFAALLAAAVSAAYFGRRIIRPTSEHLPLSSRWLPALAGLMLPVLLVASTPTSLALRGSNAYGRELSLNGVWALFHAYFYNEIEYRRFYKTFDDKVVAARIDGLLQERRTHFAADAKDHLTRIVKRDGPMQRKNVVLICMESLGAEHMAHFGNKDGITPNLDRLASEGLLFTKLLATGTRTVRGLEALTLSVPPTPGQSIVRRPNNGGLFTIGDVFRDRGYQTRFLYGGDGFFDNMNAFYAGNGFEVIDRKSFKSNEVHFENAWGVADEDLFDRAIKEADKSHEAGKRFFHLVMTTSNHRPFTYPNGAIDILSKTGRLGSVKYADYAVGRLIRIARTKPWFDDTVFVFVADHTAGTAGKIELDPTRYHIPLIFYAPGFIKPATYDKLASQIDVAPVLLGLLNTSYVSRFYGKDVLNDDSEPRAFIGIYQKVALVRGDTTVVLAPKGVVESYSGLTRTKRATVPDESVIDTVAYYQFASDWSRRSRRLDTIIHED